MRKNESIIIMSQQEKPPGLEVLKQKSKVEGIKN